MTNEVMVRIGVPDDLDEVMRLVMAATDENAFTQPSLDLLLQEVWSALNEHEGVMGVIGAIGGRLEGAVLLRVGKIWYSRGDVIEEKAVFVDKEFRSAKDGRAVKLIEFSKSYADTKKMPLAIGILSNQRTEAKCRIYERELGKPVGVFFLYNATTGAQGA